MGQTNEQFGALGLGSSSVREAQLAKQASQLSQAVGEEGLRAGVGAQEAATNRSLGAFNPALGASGQSLAADQSAFAGQLGARQFGQQGSLGGLQAGLGAANLGENARQFESGLQQQANQFNALQGGRNSTFGGGGGSPLMPAGPLRQHSLGGRAFAHGGVVEPRGTVMQRGQRPGPVNGRDHLTQLMFGTTFQTPKFNPVQQQQQSPGKSFKSSNGGFQPPVGGLVQQRQNFIPDPMSNPVNLQRRLAEDAMRRQLQMARISGEAEIQAAGPRQAALTNPGAAALNLGMQNLGFDQSGSQIFGPAIGAMAQTASQGEANRGALERQRAHQQFILDQLRLQGQPPVTGAGPGIGPGMNDGGEVPGPAVPPDVVPAEVNGGQDVMLQGGELVVPVGLRSEIEMDQSGHPTIEKLKGLVGKPPEMGMQDGGMIKASMLENLVTGIPEPALQVLDDIGLQARFGLGQDRAAKESVKKDLAQTLPAGTDVTRASSGFLGANAAPGSLVEMLGGLLKPQSTESAGAFGAAVGNEIGLNIPGVRTDPDEEGSRNSLILGMAEALAQQNAEALAEQNRLKRRGPLLAPPDQRGGTQITSPQAGAPPRGQTGFDTLLAALTHSAPGIQTNSDPNAALAEQFLSQAGGPPEQFDPTSPQGSDSITTNIMSTIGELTGSEVQYNPATGQLVATSPLTQNFSSSRGLAPGRTSPAAEARTLETSPEMQQHAAAFGQAAAEPPSAAPPSFPQTVDPMQFVRGEPVQQSAETPAHARQRVRENSTATSGALPGDQELLTAQRRATTLHNLALQSPPGSRIHQMAQEAIAKAEGLSSKRQAISEQRNALQQAMKQALAKAQFSAQAAAIPATISAQGGLQREQLRQGAMDERKMADLQARASSKILEIAIKAATQLGTFDQNIFNQVLTALAGADPSTLAGGEASAGDEALEMIRQQVDPSILDNNPL